MPLITLTARKASPDRLELRYADTLTQVTLHQEDLTPMRGIWMDVRETILYEEVGLGQYEVLISNHFNGDTLFHYSNNTIRMWKTNADFQRPKWGIYRSLNDSTNLRDEEILFADFSIEEIDPTAMIAEMDALKNQIMILPNPGNGIVQLQNQTEELRLIRVFDSSGRLIENLTLNADILDLSHHKSGEYFIQFYSHSGRSEIHRYVKQ